MSAPALAQLLVSHWHLSGALVTEAAIVAGIYVWAAVRRARRWPIGRTVSFLAGVGCVLVALGSGLDTDDDRLLSAHMVQHMLLLMLAPLLLLGGRPVILALRALPPPGRMRLMAVVGHLRTLTRPLIAVPLFYLVVIATHVPGFYDATLSHPVLHDAEHILYLLAGLLLFWPLLDGDPVPAHRLGGVGRLVYMLAAMPAMAIVGAYLNRHVPLVYSPYGAAGRALGVNALDDQFQAGAIMWVAGDLFMAAVGLWSALAAMMADERRQQAREHYAAPGAGEAGPGAAL